MPETPARFSPGDPIPAAWLNQVAEAVVQRITINRGRVQRVGTSIALQIDETPRRSLLVYKATADESGGTITAQPVDSTGAVSGDAITLTVLP
jgi:hypothetical protein